MFMFMFFFFDYLYFFFFLLFWLFYSYLNYSWCGFFFVFDSYTFILLSTMSIFILGLVFFSELNTNIIFLSQILVLISVFFFFSFNLIFLYIFFEISMFPIMIMIIGYGSQIEKINSSYYLMFYASFCSFPFLFVYFNFFNSFNLVYFDAMFSWEIVFFLTLGFMMKFPVYFLHLWLPKAHVEAPTSASMLLAGLLLKLGTSGFLRIMKSLSFIHLNFWFIIAFLGMLLGSLACIFQSDSKSLAAYSSITHMGFLLLCLLLISMEGKISSLIIMLSHGFTSTLMFYFIGELYHVSGSRMIYYMNSVFNVGLIVGIMMTLVFLSNAGVPPSLSFFAEFIAISFSLNFFNFIIIFLFLYFFLAFYYSIYFITNFLMGKFYMNVSYWGSLYSFFMIFMMFNVFWISIFF
uniref:NADH dehydrogenase subunit 4 n=1 Tax=Halicephalobus mephisto TaxID=2559892 RepID=UPI002E78EAA8|nr:NADH dehydrogenase subunit 4 [Halicephalobus mephisto]WRI60244.1 NADH dehydrogenase subunit 4 [Halicephalobus mephisto]